MADEHELSHPRHVEIARLCAEEPRTTGELARAMDMRPGAVGPTVKRLRDRGALTDAGERPAVGRRRGGRLWSLSPDWIPALEEALSRSPAPEIRDGMELVLVPLASLHACATALSLDTHAGAVAWVASLRDSTFGAVIAADSGQTEGLERFLVDLADAAPGPFVRVACGPVRGGRDLQRWAARLASPRALGG